MNLKDFVIWIDWAEGVHGGPRLHAGVSVGDVVHFLDADYFRREIAECYVLQQELLLSRVPLHQVQWYKKSYVPLVGKKSHSRSKRPYPQSCGRTVLTVGTSTTHEKNVHL